MSARLRAAGFAALATFMAVAAESRAQEAATDSVGSCWRYDTPDARFDAEVVARGLRVPVSVAFLPNGRALVAERPVGRLSYVDLASGALVPIDGVPPVVGQVDGGLLDVIVHPDFARNGWIYYAYAEHTDSGNATVVERGRLDGTSLVERVRLITVHPYIDNVNQFGARLVLDHGYLFAAFGERDVPALAQDLSTLAGKIVRLREDGSVPSDNPFAHRAGAHPEIWSLGHRNTHGLAIDPRTGALWEHEHGPRGGDEINIIRAGRNYGWPVITYGIEYSGEPVGAGETHHAGMEQPVYHYVPSIAPTGMAFYTGRDFPHWSSSLFLGSLSYRHLNRVVVSGDRVVREERLLRDRGWRIREVRQGPDGYLYLGVESGLLVRLRPQRTSVAGCERGASADDPWTVIAGSSPAPWPGAAAAYDVERKRMIWYGDATWEWDGREWTRTTSASPLVRSGAAMATDPGGGVLLFGGTSPGGAPTDETWRYDAHGWQRLDAGGPSARAGAAMAYDLDHHRALLFGGAPCDDRSLWSWDGKGWSRLVGDGPPSRRDAAMTYDLTTRSMIVAGG
ncbi:MAG: PQQ-dependent sugar dehydrogenase, partial [Gemmatimonadales bacterium]